MDELKKLAPLVEDLRKYFFAELTLMKGACDSELSQRAKKVKIVIASACSTGTAIHILGEKPEYFYSEMMMLSRSFIEKLTNFCYLQVCDDFEYEKFLLHPLYRAFHNCDKFKYTPKGKIGIKFAGREEMKKDPQIAKALSLFSETNPRKDWSDLGIDQKVAFISQRSKIRTEFFLLNTLTIYSNASESLHGSLYGCALATGAYAPGANLKNHIKTEKNLLKNTALIYAQLGSIIDELIKLLAESNKIEDLKEASNKNQDISVIAMKLIFEKNNGKKA
ncbi:MAG: DUF5677 domain-containing protein [Candidatus Paceibacterota bacterium]|jgi:hypothetical protein